MTEDKMRVALQAHHFTLRSREDGFYDIFDRDGYQVALLDWCVELDTRNDRGGELGSPYPLALGEIESVTS
jgi:hypothetical protein